MSIVYLLTDGFGGLGGIAQLNRDFLRAACTFRGGSTVLALPRYLQSETRSLPSELIYDTRAARGKLAYLGRAVRAISREETCDLVISAHINLQPLAKCISRMMGAPSMLLLHGIEAWTPPPSRVTRAAAKRADWVLAVSRFTLERFAGWARMSSERGTVLPCCVDLTRFTPGRPSPAVMEKYGIGRGTVVLTLGRLSSAERYKGVDELLKILPTLRTHVPDIVLVVAGGGDDRGRLEAEARQLGVEAHVRFTGYVPDEEIADIYRAARVFALAGHGEGFGIVLLEAMACGVPVVASTLDGSFEAIGRGALGVPVDPTQAGSLVAGLLEALRRPVGVRPAGLDFFSYDAFQARVHAALGRAIGSVRRRRDARSAGEGRGKGSDAIG